MKFPLAIKQNIMNFISATLLFLLFHIFRILWWTLSGRSKSPSVQVYHVIRLNIRATSVIRSPIMFGYFVKLVSVILSFLAVHSLVVKHCQIFHQKPVRVLSMDLFVNSKPREWSFHIFASLLFFKIKDKSWRLKISTIDA